MTKCRSLFRESPYQGSQSTNHIQKCREGATRSWYKRGKKYLREPCSKIFHIFPSYVLHNAVKKVQRRELLLLGNLIRSSSHPATSETHSTERQRLMSHCMRGRGLHVVEQEHLQLNQTKYNTVCGCLRKVLTFVKGT